MRASMDFEIPRQAIFPVERVEVALDPAPHPFEVANGATIEANWKAERAANPAVFDGRLALLSNLQYRDGVLEGRSHIVRYASFLYWRRIRPTGDAAHAFAHAIPVTADNALIAVRMGAATVNAGSVYFAAGSFEPEDFPGGKVDIDLNMAREVAEEIGIDISGLPRDPIYHAWSNERGTVIVRRYRLPMTAAEAESAIRAFVASEADPEIAEPVIIRSVQDLPQGLAPHMPPLIAWHFGEGE
jgi:8-oxo-dGTP pyrophosphatase MutT (NUDIX family)